MISRPLERQDTEHMVVLTHEDGTHRARTVLPREFFVGPGNLKGSPWRGWVQDDSALVQGLIHSGLQGPRQIGALPKGGAMRDGPHAHPSPTNKSQGHPITGQAGR